MSIIAHARIPERLDVSPTERLPRVLPDLPPAVTGALSWSTLDLKPTTPAACPLWCDGEHQVDTDGSVAHFSRQQVVTVAEVDTQSTTEIAADLCRIDSPTRGTGKVVISLDATQCALTPQHALQVADMLTYLASIALGTNTTPTGRSADWWHGYAVGLSDGSRVAEASTQETARPARTFLGRWVGHLAQLREAYKLGRKVERVRGGVR